jgi:hypothetical protein
MLSWQNLPKWAEKAPPTGKGIRILEVAYIIENPDGENERYDKTFHVTWTTEEAKEKVRAFVLVSHSTFL